MHGRLQRSQGLYPGCIAEGLQRRSIHSGFNGARVCTLVVSPEDFPDMLERHASTEPGFVPWLYPAHHRVHFHGETASTEPGFVPWLYLLPSASLAPRPQLQRSQGLYPGCIRCLRRWCSSFLRLQRSQGLYPGCIRQGVLPLLLSLRLQRSQGLYPGCIPSLCSP